MLSLSGILNMSSRTGQRSYASVDLDFGQPS
jgi:hypothetical protein